MGKMGKLFIIFCTTYIGIINYSIIFSYNQASIYKIKVLLVLILNLFPPIQYLTLRHRYGPY